MPLGNVTLISGEKGFGFIRPAAKGDDLFFHRSIVEGEFESLEVGQTVKYQVDLDAEKPRAKSVVAVSGIAEDEHRVKRHPRARRKKPTWRNEG